MREDVTDAMVRAITALGRWEREGTEDARAEHEAASAALCALANPGTVTADAQPRHLHLVWSRAE